MVNESRALLTLAVGEEHCPDDHIRVTVSVYISCRRHGPAELRGTYAGLAHPVTIDHLTRLGVTAVELLPIHQFVQDQHLIAAGRRNYWGYNSIGFFAPHPAYAITDPVREFKEMVRAFHGAGLEVILDVVYNHTAEGGEGGPTLSLRGLDNVSYYRHVREDLRTHAESFCIADETALVYRLQANRWEGIADTYEPAVAKLYGKMFDEIWLASEVEVEFRQLGI